MRIRIVIAPLLYFNDCALTGNNTPLTVFVMPHVRKTSADSLTGVELMAMRFDDFTAHDNRYIVIECYLFNVSFKDKYCLKIQLLPRQFNQTY